MSKLTIVIIARNEEHIIARCIRSVRELGKVIVADTGSSDRTIEVARSLGAETHSIEFEGFGRSKRKACSLADSEFILNLDADEVVSPALRAEIREVVRSDHDCDVYALPRLTNFCGSWVFHSGWYPEYVGRLFRADRARFSEDLIHEHLEYGGYSERLSAPLMHYSYPDMAAFRRKMVAYAELGAEKYREAGGNLAMIKLLVNPPVRFLKKLVLDRGFLDGYIGLWIAVLSAVGQFQKYWYAMRRH